MVRRSIAAIPGTMCDARLWSRMLPLLDEDLLLQHVAVENCTERDAMQGMIADIAMETGHLLGFSMGGYLALEHAVKHPNNVKSLIIMASSAKGLTAEELQRREQMMAFFAADSKIRYGGMSHKQLQQFVGAKGMEDEELVERVLSMERELGKEVFLTQLKVTSERKNLMGQLHCIICPVLIIGAVEDQKVPFYALEQMTEALPNATMVGIAQAGHMLPLEKPKLVAEAINDFYRKLE